MKIFINDIPVILARVGKVQPLDTYDVVQQCANKPIDKNNLRDHVLVVNASEEQIEQFLQLITVKKLKQLDSITFAVKNRKQLKKYIKSKFKVIEAAGGVVEKDDKVLMIYRLSKWDLPKGKLDPGEAKKKAAVREVEEECGVQTKIIEKVGKTWHTYLRNDKYNLKCTYWYRMQCIDDGQLAPQVEEDIEEVRWMTRDEARDAMYNSYRTIRSVVKKYYKIKEASVPE